MHCPTCEQEVEAPEGIVIVEGFLVTPRGRMRLGFVMQTIFRMLLRGPTATSTLISEIYGHRDDSPLDPAGCIASTLCRARPALATLGWSIVNPNRGGGSSGGAYVLRKLGDTA